MNLQINIGDILKDKNDGDYIMITGISATHSNWDQTMVEVYVVDEGSYVTLSLGYIYEYCQLVSRV